MRTYLNQPEDDTPVASGEDIKNIIMAVLDEDLPDCSTNEWFLESVNFANMVDKIMERIWSSQNESNLCRWEVQGKD